MDSEREPPSAAEIFDDLIHASSSEGFTYPSFARGHRAGNVSECEGFRVGSCWSEHIFGSLDLSSNHKVISVGATKKWTQKAQRLEKGGQGFSEGRIQARSWRMVNSYRFDFLSRANPIQVEEISYRLWCQNILDRLFHYDCRCVSYLFVIKH
jgi:hypothetical protein